ncbi:DUF418 domain-containing protein [Acanthopleuribacter pedis]
MVVPIFCVSMCYSVVMVFFPKFPRTKADLYLLSSVTMSLVYVCFALGFVRDQFVSVLAKLGRRGLTVYLSQSIVLSLLGMSYTVPPLAPRARLVLFLVALSFFALQLVLYAIFDFYPFERVQKTVSSVSIKPKPPYRDR